MDVERREWFAFLENVVDAIDAPRHPLHVRSRQEYDVRFGALEFRKATREPDNVARIARSNIRNSYCRQPTRNRPWTIRASASMRWPAAAGRLRNSSANSAVAPARSPTVRMRSARAYTPSDIAPSPPAALRSMAMASSASAWRLCASSSTGASR